MKWIAENLSTRECRDITEIAIDEFGSAEAADEYDLHSFACSLWPQTPPSEITIFAE